MTNRYCPADLPALTAEELRDIWERNRVPDVRDLLWEIARLRQRVSSAHYFIALVEAGQPGAQLMAHTYLANFAAEPCVLEDIEADYSSGPPGSRNGAAKFRPMKSSSCSRRCTGRRASGSRKGSAGGAVECRTCPLYRFASQSRTTLWNP
ncbi:hypothetical protein OJJOAM_000943 [Cupriavidus sp. H18C1]|uniref:hypothetical protein n=1 Tax=Cupriavidus sp. H18C1 TaxID=3241601 RepID=UPI003BB92434